MSQDPRRMAKFEARIGRTLIAMTLVGVGLLVVGVVLMVTHGIDPMTVNPPFDPGHLVSGLLALDPVVPLWLGLIVVLVTPVLRVIAAGIAYARQGEWAMVGVATAIVVVIAFGVATALITEA
jgi:uncharacterized membrane protein